MEEINFKYLEEKGLLLYKYVRGSKLYGLDRPESDIDYGGVYIEPLDFMLGIGIGFPEDVHDETNDESWFSLRKFSQLLLKSNPNVLESLFVPEEMIVYKHPIMDILLKERDKFVTKMCFSSFIGYARNQIEKARSLKKRITQPMDGPLKSCLEWILYSAEGGSHKVIDWLDEHGLKQEYCGLVGLEKMVCSYSMYYDWGAHLKEFKIKDEDEFVEFMADGYSKRDPFVISFLRYAGKQGIYSIGIDDFGDYVMNEELKKLYKKYEKPFKYHGLVNRVETSNQVRQINLSSIPKGEIPILDTISYNKDGYSSYCRQWNGYNDFKIHHNKERFDLAKEKSYDRKNMTHAFRLLTMGVEIAKGEGVKIDRRNIDRDFLMNIRTGGAEYEDLMKALESKDETMKKAMEESKIPEDIDKSFLNDLVVKMRREFYKI